MFLNLGKQNLLKTKVEKLSRAVKTSEHAVASKGVGIIVNADEFSEYDRVLQLAKKLVVDEEIQLVLYSKVKSNENITKHINFSDSDFSLWGTVKNSKLINFTTQPFTFLISYYQRENVFLDFLKATSNAVFKIGFQQANYDCFNDLTIKTDLESTQIFESELIKYLKIVKRLD